MNWECCSPIVFNYVGRSKFDVSVFNSSGYEIDYEKDCRRNVQVKESASSSCRKNSGRGLSFFTATQLMQNKALGNVYVNTYAYELERIQIIMKPMHLYSNNDYVVSTQKLYINTFVNGRGYTTTVINIFAF